MAEITEHEVIEMAAWRERREAEQPAPEVERLERAIARLDGILERVTGHAPTAESRADPRLETDMLAISGAISAGMVDRAAVLAEELARRLEKRAARQG
ncbi:MAG: hypothetical protein ACJ76P_09040 [Actinomycetota bacterium]